MERTVRCFVGWQLSRTLTVFNIFSFANLKAQYVTFRWIYRREMDQKIHVCVFSQIKSVEITILFSFALTSSSTYKQAAMLCHHVPTTSQNVELLSDFTLTSQLV